MYKLFIAIPLFIFIFNIQTAHAVKPEVKDKTIVFKRNVQKKEIKSQNFFSKTKKWIKKQFKPAKQSYDKSRFRLGLILLGIGIGLGIIGRIVFPFLFGLAGLIFVIGGFVYIIQAFM